MVNKNAAPQQRARDFGFYAIAMASGIALGILVGLQLFEDAPALPFLLGGAMSLLGGVLMWCALPVPIGLSDHHDTAAPLEFGRNWLSFGSAWSQGFLEGGMVAFLTTYLLFLGYSEGQASWLLGGTMIGVILFQVPVTWLADRLGRVAVLSGCYCVVGVGLAVLPLSAGSIWLGVWLFFLGACSSAFYPLGLALLGQRVSPTGLARANAWYLALNCIGSLTGPLLMGRAMDLFGKHALFGAGEGAVLFVVISCALGRLRARRASAPPSSRSAGELDRAREAA